MRGTRTFTRNGLAAGLLAAAFLGAAPAWAQADYFPLQTGNVWIYRAAADVFTLDVARSDVYGGNTYFLMRGFPSQNEAWLRRADDGRVMMWNANARGEQVWLDFTAAEGVDTPAGVDPCTTSARITSRQASYTGPVGMFDYALAVAYSGGKCADAGLVSDVFLPYVGLLQRVSQTIAGPRQHDLIYARLGGVTVVSEPEVAFSLSLDRSVYVANLMPPIDPARAIPILRARFAIRNTNADPLALPFSTGQMYDVVIRNEAGKEVYQWSIGKFFTMQMHTEYVSGEQNWVLLVGLAEGGKPLPEGRYTAEAWLTTTGAKIYSATSGFEIRYTH